MKKERMKRQYKVNGEIFQNLADAREHAETLMASRHDDDWVEIAFKETGEWFFEPHSSIVRKNGRFVLVRK